MDQKIFQSKIRSQYSMACAPLPVCSLLLAEVHASGGDPWFTGVGIVWLPLASRFIPVGAGEGVCGEGTLASPWLEGERVHRGRTRATQASPPLRNDLVLPRFSRPFFLTRCLLGDPLWSPSPGLRSNARWSGFYGW